MALIKFELKEEHIKLLKHLEWSIDNNNSIYCETENKTPFGGLSLIEDAGLILFGKPTGEFDPLSPYGPQYTDEQKEIIERVWAELPKALEICCYTQKFETGAYSKKWNLKNWKKETKGDKKIRPNVEHLVDRLEQVKNNFDKNHPWHLCLNYAIGEIKYINEKNKYGRSYIQSK